MLYLDERIDVEHQPVIGSEPFVRYRIVPSSRHSLDGRIAATVGRDSLNAQVELRPHLLRNGAMPLLQLRLSESDGEQQHDHRTRRAEQHGNATGKQNGHHNEPPGQRIVFGQEDAEDERHKRLHHGHALQALGQPAEIHHTNKRKGFSGLIATGFSERSDGHKGRKSPHRGH